MFLDQPSFNKLLTFIFTLNLDTAHYPAFHDLMNLMEDQENIFECEIQENVGDNKMFITFPKENISTDNFQIVDAMKIHILMYMW